MSWVKVEGVTSVRRETGCEGIGEAIVTNPCGGIVVGNVTVIPGEVECPMGRR